MDGTFAYTCPTNKAIVGFYSYHNNGNEDRRWRFYCAHFHGVGFRAGGWPGRQGGMPTLQLDVDTIQQLASPHTITTTRRTGSGGSGVVTDMHSVCRFFMLCFVLFSRKNSCITKKKKKKKKLKKKKKKKKKKKS